MRAVPFILAVCLSACTVQGDSAVQSDNHLRQVWDDATGRAQTDCPPDAFVIAAFGQSNAANSFREKFGFPGTASYNFYGGKCYESTDPMLGSTGNGGSLYPILGRKFTAAFGRPVVFITGAIGGQSVWSLYSDYLGSFAAQIKAYPGNVDAYIYLQGENDAGNGNPHYFGQAGLIFDTFNDLSPNAPILMFKATLCEAVQGQLARDQIRLAQQQLVDMRTDTVLVSDADRLGFDYRDETRCHFNALGVDVLTDDLIAALRPIIAP